MKMELDDFKWWDAVYEKINVSDMVEIPMATQIAEVAVPPDEEADLSLYKNLYADLEFMDDVSGALLEKDLAVQARKVEMDYFKRMNVYSKVAKQPWMKVISTRWLDVNKGDAKNPDHRARLVAREINTHKRDVFLRASCETSVCGHS